MVLFFKIVLVSVRKLQGNNLCNQTHMPFQVHNFLSTPKLLFFPSPSQPQKHIHFNVLDIIFKGIGPLTILQQCSNIISYEITVKICSKSIGNISSAQLYHVRSSMQSRELISNHVVLFLNFKR